MVPSRPFPYLRSGSRRHGDHYDSNMARTEYERTYSAARSARRVGHLVSFIGRLFMVLSVLASVAFVAVGGWRGGWSDGWGDGFSGRSAASWVAQITFAVVGLLVNLLLFGVVAAVGANTRSNASKVLLDLSVAAQAPAAAANGTVGPVTAPVVVTPAPTGVTFGQPTAPTPTVGAPTALTTLPPPPPA